MSRETRACISLSLHMYVHVRMATIPPLTNVTARGRGVRSLNFDPETAAARPLCAWPSTTGRQVTWCIQHAMTNKRKKSVFLKKHPLPSLERARCFTVFNDLFTVSPAEFARKRKFVLYKEAGTMSL